jgi:hypothetical protein
MFAGSTQSRVCHLVEANARRTLCGLRVGSRISQSPSRGRLHLISVKPDDCRICTHCHRLELATGPALFQSELFG